MYSFMKPGIISNPTVAEIKEMIKKEPQKYKEVIPMLANASNNERFLIISPDIDDLYGVDARQIIIDVAEIYNDLSTCLQKQNSDINFCVNHDEHEVYIRFKNAVISDEKHIIQSEFSLKSEKDDVFNLSVMGLMPTLLSEDDDESDGN